MVFIDLGFLCSNVKFCLMMVFFILLIGMVLGIGYG